MKFFLLVTILGTVLGTNANARCSYANVCNVYGQCHAEQLCESELDTQTTDSHPTFSNHEFVPLKPIDNEVHMDPIGRNCEQKYVNGAWQRVCE